MTVKQGVENDNRDKAVAIAM